MSKFFIATSSEQDKMNRNEPYMLQFPCGLIINENKKNQYIVTYGEGDIRCKLMFIDKTDIIFYDNNAFNTMAHPRMFFEILISTQPPTVGGFRHERYDAYSKNKQSYNHLNMHFK